MGKNTGGNRKKGRAGAGGAAANVGPGQQLAGPQAAGVTSKWVEAAFGTTNPSKLFSERGLTVDVSVAGDVTIWAQGDGSSLQGFAQSLSAFAFRSGFELEATSGVLPLPNGEFQKYKLVGG